MSASLQENKDLVVRLQRYLRKHTVYKDVEVKDYMINKHGSIKITYDLAGKEQIMRFKLKDIGISIARGVRKYELLDEVLQKAEKEKAYKPFNYLMDSGVKL